jgi:hypothetical protein
MNMKLPMSNVRTVIAMAAILISASAARAQNYTYHVLNVPGASSTTATGINNENMVVGTYTDATGTHGFIYSPAGKYYVYPINDPKGPNDSATLSMNNSLYIVGSYSPGQGQTAMIDQGGTFYDIAVNGCFNAEGTGISDGNVTVGNCEYQTPDNVVHSEAWVTFFGTNTYLCPGAVDTFVNAVNNNLQTVGTWDASNMGPIHGFVGSVGSFGSCQTLDYPNAFITNLTGVNDSGTIIGNQRGGFTGNDAAFLYVNGSFIDIVPPLRAKKGMITGQINNNGWFVGTYFDRYSASHTFYAKPI